MNYTLQNEFLAIKFHTLGGQITSIKNTKEIEYIWQGDKTYWSGQTPVLFPIVGSLRDKTATIGGNRTCCMERHGLVRKLEFDMINLNDDSILFSICSNKETLERYPYYFRLLIKYLLNKNSVIVKYTIINQNDDVLPFQIGGHPGFNCPLIPGENFEDYVVEFEQVETADCPTPLPANGLVDMEHRTRILENSNTLKLNHDLFRVDALIFDQVKSRKVKLYHPNNVHYVELLFEDFNNLLIWSSANSGPFVALEPWSGLSTCSDENDIFEEKRGVHFLPPQQSKSLSYTIVIE
jgi:galactose mutarotase-like enzyme